MGAYSDSGVDIDKAERIVQRIKPLIKGNTGFAATRPFFMPIPDGGIVTSTDGVGTKSTLANTVNFHAAPNILGQDLVAMVVNDLITNGSVPMYFLDYIAMNKLDEDYVVAMVQAIDKACAECGMELVGGETAEMPNHYRDDRYVDLVGFGVAKIDDYPMDGTRIKPGDKLLALKASGPHANGYSLINKLVNYGRLPIWGDGGEETERQLLEPTRLYYPIIRSMAGRIVDADDFPIDTSRVIRACANITGGGIIENIPRMFRRDGLQAKLDYGMVRSLRLPIFDKIMEADDICEGEMYRTFNMGIGFVVCASEKWTSEIICAFTDAGEQVYLIGEIVEKDPADPLEITLE